MVTIDKLDETIKQYLDKLKVEDGDKYKELLSIQASKALDINNTFLIDCNFKPSEDTAAINIIMAGILLLNSPPSTALNIIYNKINGYLPEVTHKSNDND